MRRILATVTVLLASVTISAPAADAHVRGKTPPSSVGVDYVALGDSYAAGVGAIPDPASGSCLRSDGSYPALWTAAHPHTGLVFVACSGATTTDVLAGQVRSVTRSSDLVTITVGGNDIGFAPVLTGCTVATTDAGCGQLVAAAEAVARYVLPVQLARVYLSVRLRAPHARIVVLGYPRLFDLAPDCANPLVPDLARRTVLNEGADVLDDSIRATATKLGLGYADVRAAFAGHGVCSAQPWIVTPASVPPAGDVYHPTAQGYQQGYLPVLESVTG